MREYKVSKDFVGSQENLLEQVLGDAIPVVASSSNGKYDIASRPTELSSGGYVDITD